MKRMQIDLLNNRNLMIVRTLKDPGDRSSQTILEK